MFFLSTQEEIFLAGELLLALSNAGLVDAMMQENETILPSLCALFFQGLCTTMLLKFLTALLKLVFEVFN